MAYAYNGAGVKNSTSSINTDGLALYGPESALRLDFYNHFISIKIFPIKPETERTPKSVYDYSKRISLSLAREDAYYIAWYLENEIIPKSLKNEPAYMALVSAKSNLFAISNGIKENGKLSPCIYVHKGLDAKFIPTESVKFEFRPQRVITDYDPTAGTISGTEDYRTGLIILLGFFKHCAELSGAGIHALRYLERYRRANHVNFMQAASAKLGFADYYRANYVNSGRTEPNWESATPEVPMAEEAPAIPEDVPVSSASSLDDISSLL
jgi:hypothetical protein